MNKKFVISTIALLVIVLLIIQISNRDINRQGTNKSLNTYITIDRKSNLGGLFSKYKIYINNGFIGSISNGDIKSYEIKLNEGANSIYLKKLGIKSKTIKFNVNKEQNQFRFITETSDLIGIKLKLEEVGSR